MHRVYMYQWRGVKVFLDTDGRKFWRFLLTQTDRMTFALV